MSKEVITDKIFYIVTNPPCKDCEYWDVQGHSCFLEGMHKNTNKCILTSHILKAFEDIGGVFITEEELPENPYKPNPLQEYDHQITEAGKIGYAEAQQDMLKAGFKKVITNV